MNSERYYYRAGLLLILILWTQPGIYADITITNDLLQKRTAAPGEHYTGVVSIKNVGNRSERVQVWQTDFRWTADGTQYFDAPGTSPRSNAPWIQLSRQEVVLMPDQETAVPYAVTVPDDNTLVGTYWSLLMVQEITDSFLNPENQNDGSIGVTAGIRYGVQLVTNLSNLGIGRIAFLHPSFTRQEDGYLLQVEMYNNGEKGMNLHPSVRLYGAAGENAGCFEIHSQGLYPETAKRISFKLPFLAPGTYQAQVIADGGGNDLFGVLYTLNFK